MGSFESSTVVDADQKITAQEQVMSVDTPKDIISQYEYGNDIKAVNQPTLQFQKFKTSVDMPVPLMANQFTNTDSGDRDYQLISNTIKLHSFISHNGQIGFYVEDRARSSIGLGWLFRSRAP